MMNDKQDDENHSIVDSRCGLAIVVIFVLVVIGWAALHSPMSPADTTTDYHTQYGGSVPVADITPKTNAVVEHFDNSEGCFVAARDGAFVKRDFVSAQTNLECVDGELLSAGRGVRDLMDVMYGVDPNNLPDGLSFRDYRTANDVVLKYYGEEEGGYSGMVSNFGYLSWGLGFFVSGMEFLYNATDLVASGSQDFDLVEYNMGKARGRLNTAKDVVDWGRNSSHREIVSYSNGLGAYTVGGIDALDHLNNSVECNRCDDSDGAEVELIIALESLGFSKEEVNDYIGR